MKYLLSLVLFLVGCSKYPCNKIFKDYKYSDKVVVLNGFFRHQVGMITSQAWVYESNPGTCNSPAFTIKLSLTGEKVNINQIDLEKTK